MLTNKQYPVTRRTAQAVGTGKRAQAASKPELICDFFLDEVEDDSSA
jgi:hypothetical protein